MSHRPVHFKSDLSRILESMQPIGARRLPLPPPAGRTCSPSKFDEYGVERLTAADHREKRRKASAVIKCQNRHVVAYSLRATRGMTDHKIALYLDVDIPRARQMMTIGHGLLLTSATVKARFPDLARTAWRSVS